MAGEDQAITGTVEITADDLTRGVIESSGVFSVRWVYVGMFAGVAASWISAGMYSHLYQWIWALGSLAAFTAYVLLAPRARARKQLASMVRAGDCRIHYRFDNEGLTVRSPGATATVAYRVLTHFREGQTTFLLISGPGSDFFFPKRAFAPEDLERVRGLLTANVKFEEGIGQRATVVLFSTIAILAIVILLPLLYSRPR